MTKLSIWLRAVRPFSFTASVIPVVIGAVAALGFEGAVAWSLFPLVVIASVAFHAATNLVSDYFDYENEVDKDYTFGSSGIIVEGQLKPKQALVGGLILFVIGLAIGIIFFIYRGWPIAILGIVGFLGGFFYCGRPVGYKYLALGDLGVFILMGPLMVIGSYLVLTGTYSHSILLISLPIGMLVTAILHANNTRDIKHDLEAKIKTMANQSGHRLAKIEYSFLVTGPYPFVLILIAVDIISIWSLLVFLSIPLALKNINLIKKSDPEQPETIAFADVETAKLHLLFGLLFAAAITIGAFVS